MPEQKPKLLHEGNMVLRMAPPNHLVPLEPDASPCGRQFPLLQVTRKDDHGERRGVFFAELYDLGWSQWCDRAPTWMDPHLFVEMCLADQRVQAVLQQAFKANDEKPAKSKLPELLDEIFDTQYMPYVLDKFSEHKGLFSEWLVRHHCSKETDPTTEATRKRRRKPKE